MWFTFINLVKKRSTFVYSKLKLQSISKLGYIDERYKVTSVRLKLAQLLTTRHKFVCFGVTSSVDIDLAQSIILVSGSLAQS